ncbi:MAG: IPT/TIG domain-containing protein [Pyrinomonadaceae bacterium]
MALFEGKTKSERYKLAGALVLPLIALVLVFRMLFASDKPTPVKTPPKKSPATPTLTAGAQPTSPAGDDEIAMPTGIDYRPVSYNTPDPARNIFAFYVKPTPTPGAAKEVVTPTPTPTPPPPQTLGSVQPANVFARTGDFTLEITGDKFTPQTHVFVDGQEAATTFKSAQQLSAAIPASFVQSPGSRAVIVHTPDNALYSNTQTFNVMPPPVPQFTFIGIFGTKRYADKAILKATAGSDLLTVQRGDVVGGRFKVTGISERSVDLIDTQLNIKHSIPYTDAKGATGGVAPRAAQQTDDDGEP